MAVQSSLTLYMTVMIVTDGNAVCTLLLHTLLLQDNDKGRKLTRQINFYLNQQVLRDLAL